MKIYQNKNCVWHFRWILSLMILMCCCRTANAQYTLPESKTITLQQKSITLEQAIHSVQKQCGISIFYSNQLLNRNEKISVNYQNTSLKEVLDDLFTKRNFEWRYYPDKNTILIVPEKKKDEKKNKNLSESRLDNTVQQPFLLHGHVTDTTGNPLDGATIIVQNHDAGIHSDAKGNFLLSNINPGDTLAISYIGYDSQILTVPRTGNYIFAVLRQSQNELDATMVQAYGTTTKRFSVSDISKITADDIASQPVMNPLAALEGRIPGLLVTTNTGNPGASFNIQVRGQNTINSAPGGNLIFDNPLFIIDGVPFAPQNSSSSQLQTIDDIKNVQTTSNVRGLSPFNSINPSDIESIEVLKDADATAIYGSRGANGVILITTKRGSASKTTVNGTLYTGVDQVTRTLPLLSTQQYLKMRREAFSNDGITPNTTAGSPGYAPDLLIFDTTRYSNFMDELFGGNATTNSANISIQGGSSTNTFYIGAGYDRETYVNPGSFADNRISGSASLHHNSINRKFAIDLATQYSYDHNNVPGSPAVLSAFTLVPDLPNLRNPDGSLLWYYNGTSLSTLLSSFTNPLAYLNQNNNAQMFNLNTNLVMSYQIISGLTAKVSMGYNSFISNEASRYPSTAQNPAYTVTSTASASNSNGYAWIIEPQLNYVRRFGKSQFNILVGNTEQKTGSSNLQVNGSGFPNDLLLGSIGSAKTITSSQTYTPYKYSGSFGRINCIYDNQYIVDITGRIDGSSRFISGKQWGKFGAVGAGWIFTENKFIKRNLSFMSYGKIRGSYGTSGNDNVGNYQYVSNWQSFGASYIYNGSVGYRPTNLENPNFSWSLTKKLELGLETGFSANRLLVSASWYRDRSGAQLIQYSLPSQTGFSYVTKNFQAVIQNSGWEFAITSNNIKGKFFTWTTTANLSIPHNKLLSFPGLAASSYGNYYTIGKPISIVLGYKYAGINDTTGVYQFYTKSGEKTYTPNAANGDSKFVLGNPDPKFYGGMGNTFTYKGFALNVFIEFRKQTGFNYVSQVNNPFGYMTNLPEDALNTWKKPGDHAAYQKLTSQSYNTDAGKVWSYYRLSTATYSDASFIRIKTVGLSYTVKKEWLQKMNMDNLRIFVNAQNLFTITNYKGNDPENQNYYGTPPMRTIAGGLQFNF